MTTRLLNAYLFKTKAAAANCAKSLGKGRKWLVAKATITEELAMERATRVTGG